MEARLKKGHVVSQGSDDVFEQTMEGSEGSCGSAALLSSPSLVRSEKGQQVRDAYRSSGYGTGSGDNTSGSANFQVSAEHPQQALSDEACAVMPQANLIPDLKKEAQKCIENDFKPRTGAVYSQAISVNTAAAVPNPTQREAEPRLCANKFGQTALSLSTKEAGGTHISKQKSCTYEPNVSMKAGFAAIKQTATVSHLEDLTTSLVQAMEDSTHIVNNSHWNINVPRENMAELHETNGSISTDIRAEQKQQQQQQQQQVADSASLTDATPRHVNPQHCLPANCMPESRMSGLDVPPGNFSTRLGARTKPCFRRQDELQDFGAIAGTLECSREDDQRSVRSYHDANNAQIIAEPNGHTPSFSETRFISGDDTSSSFYLSEQTSSIGCQFDDAIFKVLEKCARCQDASCDNVDCLKMRKEFAHLMDMRTELLSLNEHHRLLLQTAFSHVFYQCSHPKCPIPWCGDNMDKNLTLDEGLRLMKQRIENYAEYCSLFSSPVEEFMKLNNSFELDSLPLEGKHWERISMLNNSRKTILASPVRSEFSSEYKYWVIKKQNLGTDNLHHWDLYSRLRDLNHRSIATMLWAAKFKHHLLICHMFENLTLRDCLHEASPQQMGLTTICQILQQMISAVNYLHNLGVVYLYWMSKNILVSCLARESFCVKISNFSCSVILDNYDGGQLYLTLPPAIMPPELRADSTVETVSDAWGLGCLLYEATTGAPVWHERRHLSDADLQEWLGKNPVPEIPSTYAELISLFRTCWEIDWNKRKTVRDLEQLLADIYL